MNYELKKEVTARGGFTIVETIVAIAVLSLVIVAPLTLAQRSLNSSIYAKDQVTAFYLAQEAIEFARNVRDNNNLQDRSQTGDWLKGLETCINNQCGIDINSGQIIDCSRDAGSCQMTFNPSTYIYGESRNNGNGRPLGNFQDTIFTRSLIIGLVGINGDSNAAADLTATVSWTSGAISRIIQVKERIFDWFPAPAQ